MNDFNLKNILEDHEKLAQILKDRRQKRNISIEKAARETKINYKYLQIMENGQFEKLPAGIYGKNFIREYAFFLGLKNKEWENILFAKEKNKEKKEQKYLFIRKKPKSWYFITIPKLIKNLLIGLLLIISLSYLGFYIKNIIAAPDLIIYNPKSDITTTNKIMTIEGATDIESSILINNKEVLIDEQGHFKKDINLNNGLNTIVISAQKKHSRTNTVIRKILVEDN